MDRLGVMLPDELYGLGLGETVEFAKLADNIGYHSVWKGEASASNGLMALAAIAQETEDVHLGIGVANVFSRTPSLLGMSAATLDSLSNGRAILGLGVSTEALVQNWHSVSFDRPLRRLREAIEITRQVVEGGRVEYDGEIFDVGPFRSLVKSPNQSTPIYTAAIGPVNRRLTGEFADGWLPAFIPERDFSECVRSVKDAARAAGRDPDDVIIAPMVGVAVDEDPDEAEWHMREFLAQEMAMGYNRQVRTFGFGDEPDRVHNVWLDGNREEAAKLISTEMLNQLSIHGSAEHCRDHVRKYHAMGADVVIVFPSYTASPDHIENTYESFSSLT